MLAASYPVPMEFVGVKDTFGHSGAPLELLRQFGLTPEQIATCAKKAIGRKK